MEVRKDWAALISQTGSEVIAIAKKTGYLPGLLVTNRPHKIPEDNVEYLREQGVRGVTLPLRPLLEHYLIPELLDKKLITLHGYLRIIPPGFFDHFQGKIYNGHPALISKYEELKGFNKQEDIAGQQEKYPTCGSVIHEVIPELDSGKIVTVVEVDNTAKTIEEAYSLLRETSLQSWGSFFSNVWKFEK